MKNFLILATAFFVSSSAFASFYQTECSDASGKIRMSNGHVRNTFVFTERGTTNGSPEIETELSTRNIAAERLETVELETESNVHCEEGANTGYWSSETTEAVKMVISKADGSLFPEGTYGANQDRTAIEAFLLCKHVRNGIAPCNHE